MKEKTVKYNKNSSGDHPPSVRKDILHASYFSASRACVFAQWLHHEATSCENECWTFGDPRDAETQSCLTVTVHV